MTGRQYLAHQLAIAHAVISTLQGKIAELADEADAARREAEALRADNIRLTAEIDQLQAAAR